MNRRGMTLIELLVTLTIIGILANIALPALNSMRRRAEAVRVIADIAAIRTAGLDYYAGANTFPPAGQWGTVPPLLAPSLPTGFAFGFRDVEYRWERWLLPSGLPSDRAQTEMIGVTVRAPDAFLLAALRGVYKGRVTFGSSSEITFVLE